MEGGHSRLPLHPTSYGELSCFVLHRASRRRIVPLGFLEAPSKSVTATYRPAPITLRPSVLRRFARPKPCLDAKKGSWLRQACVICHRINVDTPPLSAATTSSNRWNSDDTSDKHKCIGRLHVCGFSRLARSLDAEANSTTHPSCYQFVQELDTRLRHKSRSFGRPFLG